MRTTKFTSPLEWSRSRYQPPLPKVLKGSTVATEGESTTCVEHVDQIKKLFPKSFGKPIIKLTAGESKVQKKPLKVGIVLSGGPAPGGHNVIVGLYRFLKKHHRDSKLLGFKGGLLGVVKNDFIEIDSEKCTNSFNLGGFHMLGTGRDKIDSEEKKEATRKTAVKQNLNGLVIIGGDDSNTNAAVVCEDFLKHEIPCQVIGVPKTIDGDLQNEYIETSFGFDTATKVYSELIGNIMMDCLSSRKYWHFVRLMGRSASHIALECTLQTHPNLLLVGEFIEKRNVKFIQIVNMIADIICKRFEKGNKKYGVVIIPEGLILFIPDFKQLLDRIDEMFGSDKKKKDWKSEDLIKYLEEKKDKESKVLFQELPKGISSQLLLTRDPHGNVDVSKIETGKLLKWSVRKILRKRARNIQDEYSTSKKYFNNWSCMTHFFGYEGRCGFPSNFDCNYCNALGHTAGHLLAHGKTGAMAVVRNLTDPVEKWVCSGIPITAMLNMEKRLATWRPVIRKTLVDLKGRPYKTMLRRSNEWGLNDYYRSLGPIQFEGFNANSICKTLMLNQSGMDTEDDEEYGSSSDDDDEEEEDLK
ncbi:pyrophosphate--fructose 6-phosphate 1-phosphotransferase [Anaeramoeba flamelloides]|uniref:Pyrophosphate--fructose 6-phosphate 1-phosphotransferase n=1 Tax=Anaeramoeba flamelloides TaxID=1746091 RepID=A0AAV7YFE2_9EUKA|nr:pyrophosphate--fructose 6-phosphate 1-phosphotransferase [Anaeramoeba flamelloides]KAJ6237861.1 pyrophosphate--fructose 6-phosphate 1-phosphotransferase [Anaeramoeba flamelloides]